LAISVFSFPFYFLSSPYKKLKELNKKKYATDLFDQYNS